MPQSHFNTYMEACRYAKQMASKERKEYFVKKSNENQWVVSTSDASTPGNHLNETIPNAGRINHTKNRSSNIKNIESLTKTDIEKMTATDFQSIDRNTLSRIHNRLLELDENSNTLALIKQNLERQKPPDVWAVDADGIGGSREDVKRMRGQDFSDMRRRGQ